FTEQDSAWVDLVGDVTWINGGKEFLWPSERDGWRHVYRIARDGKTAKLVTNGAFDINGIEGVDEKGGWIYYAASPDNATQRYLYRSHLDGSGKAERVSSAAQAGFHFYDISPDARWAFHFYSNTTTVPTTELVKLPSQQVVRVLLDNARLAAAAKPVIPPVGARALGDRGPGGGVQAVYPPGGVLQGAASRRCPPRRLDDQAGELRL